MSAAAPDMPCCGARKRQGEGTCTQVAGWGTDHVGEGRCKFHGGCTTSHRLASVKSIALSLAGVDDVEPHDALLEMLGRAYRTVAACEAQLWLLDDDDVIVTQLREVSKTGGQWGDAHETIESNQADLNLWAKAYLDAMDRCVRYADLCIKAKVEERIVAQVERDGAALAQVVGAVLDGFGLRSDPRAPEIVRRAFDIIEGGRAA